MATMVCQGLLQPCVDSQFLEPTWPRMAASFQFAFNSSLPDPDSSNSNSLNQCHDLHHILLNYNNVSLPLPPSNDGPKKSDGQELAKSTMAAKELAQEPAAYVHPLVKRSRSSLSEKSLALCTENLGSETGAADFLEDVTFSDLKLERSPMRKRVKSDNRGNKKLFPPPLTTISSEDSIRVRSYREDGRLIMEVVKAPARLSYFHVERSHGRLRLSILKSRNPKFDSVEEETTEKEKVTRNDVVDEVGEKGNCEEDEGGKVKERGNFGGAEIEIEKLERPCRCKCNEAGQINSNNNNNNTNENKNNTEMLLFTREPLSIWVST